MEPWSETKSLLDEPRGAEVEDGNGEFSTCNLLHVKSLTVWLMQPDGGAPVWPNKANRI